MLKKLLKYDLENTYKVLIVFYLLSIFFGVLTRLFLNINDSFIIKIIGTICSGATISMMISILINNIMRLWVRFLRNLYKDESYLTHTLPVKKETLYLSKILASIITLLTSALVIALTLFIAYYSKENIEFLKNTFLPIATTYKSTTLKILLAFLFILFLELENMIQSGYTGIILGHRMNNNKMSFSIFFGFIAYMISQISVVVMLFIFALFNKDIMNLFFTTNVISVDIIKVIVALGIFIYTIVFIVTYLINNALFKKGVNVD